MHSLSIAVSSISHCGMTVPQQFHCTFVDDLERPNLRIVTLPLKFSTGTTICANTPECPELTVSRSLHRAVFEALYSLSDPAVRAPVRPIAGRLVSLEVGTTYQRRTKSTSSVASHAAQ
ncbi:hypothetical protein P879_10558 [Paragonimus westermani]|uniref:Uncharacterized protein n=1 Tax=Paragonimus westermani TaxID=34504 RepID=A0A8T0DBS4_9TREM|nr:hypothetical protein P879_10558 [Paragonimus westermani]